MSLTPCHDGAAFAWLAEQPREWFDICARGPVGYAKYARLRFLPDPSYAGQRESDADEPEFAQGEQIAIALSILAAHTRTAADCCFGLWDGWPWEQFDEQPTVSIPNRDYWLFRGSITDLGSWGGRESEDSPDPAFVWPADRSWCYTCDVDPHFATIAGSARAIDELIADPRIDAVADDPDEDPPRYW